MFVPYLFPFSNSSLGCSALLTDIQSHYQDPARPYPKGDSPLMFELTTYLDWAGMADPWAKIYVTTRNLPHFALLCFLFVLSQLQKLSYVRSVGKYSSLA